MLKLMLKLKMVNCYHAVVLGAGEQTNAPWYEWRFRPPPSGPPQSCQQLEEVDLLPGCQLNRGLVPALGNTAPGIRPTVEVQAYKLKEGVRDFLFAYKPQLLRPLAINQTPDCRKLPKRRPRALWVLVHE